MTPLTPRHSCPTAPSYPIIVRADQWQNPLATTASMPWGTDRRVRMSSLTCCRVCSPIPHSLATQQRSAREVVSSACVYDEGRHGLPRRTLATSARPRPKCSVSSAANPRSKASLSNAGNKPWLPVISTSPASRRSNNASNAPELRSSSTASRPLARAATTSSSFIMHQSFQTRRRIHRQLNTPRWHAPSLARGPAKQSVDPDPHVDTRIVAWPRQSACSRCRGATCIIAGSRARARAAHMYERTITLNS